MQRAGQRRLAAAGEAGEEEHQPLLVEGRLLQRDDVGDGLGKRSLAGGSEHVARGIGIQDPIEHVAVQGAALPCGQRDGHDHRGVEESRCVEGHSQQAGSRQPAAGIRRRPVSGEREQQHSPPGCFGADPVEVMHGEWGVHRHGEGIRAEQLLVWPGER